ncbi:TonB-dependent receptor plug domain-containing protein [Amphritea sp. HPY]|uniref:TonB-dependent receptor plug domain-containing protein n=1 Tax=Amphritea sp. HPY TaxID=3421652 RepID=UPI003D7EADBE
MTAASENIITEADYLDDIPIIFSATRLPQHISEAPASVTVIDRTMIEASSALTIPDLLRLVPGMQSYNTATNTSAAAYHGMSDKFPPRMEVMLNGRSIYVPLFSTVIWDTLPVTVDDIDHIEVIRGSNTVTQGSNAFLGAINIITNTPLSQQGSSLKYTTGEFNTKNIELRHSADTDIGHYSISAGTLDNNGYIFHNGDRDPAVRRYFNFSTKLSPTLQDTFTLELGLSNGFTTVGDIDAELELARRDYDTHYQHLNWNRLVGDNSELNLSYSHTVNNLEADNLTTAYVRNELGTDPLADAYSVDREEFAQEFLDANAPFRAAAEVGDVEQHDIEASIKHHYSPLSTIILGAGYKLDRARSREIMDTTDWISSERSRLFASWEYKTLNDWTFNSGAMLEHSDIGGTKISPRLAANYQLTPLSTLRTSYTQAYRIPSLLDAHYQSIIYNPATIVGDFGPIYEIDVLANPDIGPEKINSFDIGYLAQWPEYSSQLDLRLFYEEISNGISTSYQILDTPIIQPGDIDEKYRTELNRAQWINRGIETQYKYQPDSPLRPLLVFNYGYIDSRGYRNYGAQSGPGTADVIDQLEQRNPMHTASLLASITLPGDLQISMTGYFLSQVRWLEGGGKLPHPTYHRTDIKLAKALRLQGDKQLRLSLIVQNLRDDPYPEFYQRNTFERRTYLQARLSF